MHRPWLARCTALLLLAPLAAGCSDDERERRRALGPDPSLTDVLRVADPERGGRLFARCAACHTIGRGSGDRNGPNLFDVMGKPLASNSKRFSYTGALRSLGKVWSPDQMDAWLAAPAKFAPGTSMTFTGIADPLDRGDVIAYLQAQSERPDDRQGRRAATPADQQRPPP